MDDPADDAGSSTIEATDVVAMDAVIGDLYEILRKDIPFEDKAQQALDLGKEFLGMDNGHLTRIDMETNHWEAIVSTDPPDGQLPAGTELDFGTTYCRRVIETEAQVGLHDAPNQGWANDIAYQTYGLDSYLGTSIVIDGQPYGTVCFVGENAREEPFTELERLFARFLTQLLERELETEVHHNQLTRQTNLAIVLNRVLRHNLRNDLAVIRGYTEMMANEQGSNELATNALENIDELLELSEKARALDEVVGSDMEPYLIDLRAMTAGVVEDVQRAYPAATISITGSDEIQLKGLPSLERAIRELLENAAKHAGETPTIGVTVQVVPNAVEVRISDDGPGMNEQDAKVLRTGSETSLVHGSGLGLWLAHWIVTSHDGDIDLDGDGEGTTLTVRIPRHPDADVSGQLSELTRARDQYEAAFKEANDAMVMIDDEARIVEANAAASEIYGMDEANLLGQRIPRFLPDELDFEREWERFLEGELDRDTVTIIGDDGTRRSVEYTARPEVIPGQHLLIVRELPESKANPTPA